MNNHNFENSTPRMLGKNKKLFIIIEDGVSHRLGGRSCKIVIINELIVVSLILTPISFIFNLTLTLFDCEWLKALLGGWVLPHY